MQIDAKSVPESRIQEHGNDAWANEKTSDASRFVTAALVANFLSSYT
jgi:hypothetical protein